MDVAERLIAKGKYRWIGYELIANHPETFSGLDHMQVEALGKGMDSWHAVDEFARLLSGPAWVAGLIVDDVIRHWARSPDFWWRRAALVSTVAWNMRSHGGRGDVGRTLLICEMLVKDRDDMVVKALSWALRELLVHDAQAVRSFLDDHQGVLAARVRREVTNKLETGLKNPRARL
jgi:3-methyladenine DNA glycosylase AlkD